MGALSRTCLALTATTLLGACAGLEFYKAPTMTSEDRIGIKFYIPKPYLLVARTGNKDKPTDISVVYLPDMQNPVYAKPVSGYGSAKLSMNFTNGMLASFGQETDTKIPESLTALGGFGKAVAEARKINREALGMELQSGVDYKKQSDSLRAAATDLRKIAVPGNAGVDGLTNGEIQNLASFISILEVAANALADPIRAPDSAAAVIVTLKQLMQSWKQVADPPAGVSQPVRQRIMLVRTQVQAVLDAITPKGPEEPTFTLYEIDNSSGDTKLREVRL